MKKLLFSLSIFLVTGFSVNAQTGKGTLLLGGGASLASSGGTTVFTFNPEIGYFFAKNLAAGIEAAVATSSGSSAWAAGPYMKPYFGGNAKGKFFGKASFLVGGATGTDTEVGFGAALGYAIFLNESVALEIYPQYAKIGAGDGVISGIVAFQIHFRKK